MSTKDRQNINTAIANSLLSPLATVGDGIATIDDTMSAWGYRVAWDMPDFALYEGETKRNTFRIFTEDGDDVSNTMMVVAVYRFKTGRYEFVVYAS